MGVTVALLREQGAPQDLLDAINRIETVTDQDFDDESIVDTMLLDQLVPGYSMQSEYQAASSNYSDVVSPLINRQGENQQAIAEAGRRLDIIEAQCVVRAYTNQSKAGSV